MTVQDWLKQAETTLSAAGITTARLDCLVLLGDELQKDKSWLLSHPEQELQGSEIENLNTKIVQRALHVPLAYLRGHAEFYGRDFFVNSHTLVPRPETETIIDLLQRLVSSGSANNSATCVDIGTGSGAIAISAKLELPNLRVIATDIDAECLTTAAHNAQALQADVTFLHGNLLEPLFEQKTSNNSLYIILANLPYVPDNFQINTAATHEPRHALFGGPDGLDLYRELFDQIQQNNWKPHYILAESLPPQHEVLTGIAKAAGFALQQTDDFIQVFTLLET